MLGRLLLVLLLALQPALALAYERPGVISGVDYGHIAAKNGGLIFAAAADRSTGKVRDFASGLVGTLANSSISFDQTQVGVNPAIKNTGASTGYIGFQTSDTAAIGNITIAAVGILNATGTNKRLFSSNSNNGFCLGTGVSSATNLTLSLDGFGSADSGIAIPVGVPVFMVASQNQATNVNNYVLKRLDTGAVSTGTSGNVISSPITSNGKRVLGGASVDGTGATRSWDGWIGFVVATRAIFSLSELAQWANDPWGVFRDAGDDIPELIALTPPAAPAGGVKRLPLMGVGQNDKLPLPANDNLAWLRQLASGWR